MKKIYLILFSLVASLGSGVKAQETAETVDVTYTYTLDGQTLGTRTVTETVGEAPADQASIPTYVTATGYPTTIGESTTSYTISTSYNNNMPFGVSTDGCRFYYTINFGSSGTYYWRTVYGGNKSEQSSGTPADRFTNPVYRWSIEGDWFNGFLLRNNDGKYITAPDGDFAATTEYYVTFGSEATARSRFLMTASGNFWRFSPKDANREIYLAHTSYTGLKISLYYRDNYSGWGVQFNHILPQDGKAYYLRNYGQNSAHTSWLLRANAAGALEACAYSEENKTQAAVFVCHVKDGNKYVFANALTGDYLIWRGNLSGDGYNSNKGFMADYNATYCDFSLPTNAKFPGLVALNSKRSNGTTDGTFVLNTSSGAFDKWGNSLSDRTDYSNHFVLEEADYPHNSVTLKTPATADGYNYASLYLPFAAALPEGVEAYTATREAGSGYMTLQPVTEAIPARTAVVLRSAEATDAVFVPAAVATTAVADNILQGTIGTGDATPADTYVLSGAFSAGIGFYPYTAGQLPAYKAYLTATDVPVMESGVNGLLLGGGTSTSIGGIAAEEGRNDANVVYDLSGRRVMKARKGLYIVNGKKVIVK